MTESIDRVIRTDIQMQIVARDGQVHLLFSEEDREKHELRPAFTSNFLLSAGDALTMSTLLADLAFETETGLKPAGDVVKSELVDRHRTKLTNRLTLMFNTMREKKTKSNRALAKEVVDIVLKEVFT